jgi:hypothetical protein
MTKHVQGILQDMRGMSCCCTYSPKMEILRAFLYEWLSLLLESGNTSSPDSKSLSQHSLGNYLTMQSPVREVQFQFGGRPHRRSYGIIELVQSLANIRSEFFLFRLTYNASQVGNYQGSTLRQ